MKTQIIQLERHDDAVSVRDKMSWAKTPRILLVWPGHGRILTRRLDLVLLRRHSYWLGAQLALATRDSEVLENARELGIPCFPNIQKAQNTAWRRPRGRRIRRLRRKTPQLDLRATRPDPKIESDPWVSNRFGRWTFFGIGILAVLLLAAFLLPSAVIHLSPAAKDQRIDLAVTASPRIQAVSLSGQIPAVIRSITVEARDTSPSTGKIQIPDKPATGRVSFTQLSDQPVDIPAGTIVSTSGEDPIRFQTTREINLDGEPGERTEAAIQSVLPGKNGNLPAGRISAVEGRLGLLVTVQNGAPTTGGSDRSSPSPVERDLKDLRERLLSKLQLSALTDLEANLEAGDRLIPASLRLVRIVDETAVPQPGQPSDHLELSIRADYQVWVVLASDLRQLAAGSLDASLQEGYLPREETLKVIDKTTPVLVGSNIQWKLEISREIVPQISKDRLAGFMTGKPISQAPTRIRQTIALDAPPRIELSPAWWPWMPFLTFRIQIDNSGGGS